MSTSIKTEAKAKNHIFNYVAIFIIIAGLILFYTLHINIWFKWSIVIITILAAAWMFFFVSPTGLNLHAYLKETWREVNKVVWPTRKETIQFTWIVGLFVIILGLFLWLIDSGLSWLFYSVILGKGN